VTAGCATMDPLFAITTGFLGGLVCFFAMSLMAPFLLDDAVGAVAVHGAAGIWGTIAAGLFKSGDLFNLALVKVQLIGIGAAFVWAFPMAFVTFKVINAVVGLRVGSKDEQRGLDFTEHYELGYPEFQDAVLHAGKA
jgi:ammonium transporter, Amt family